MVFWTLVLAVLVWVIVLEVRYPVRPRPRWKFRSLIPVLLNTGAVTMLGWCFVRQGWIRSHHRAHEEYHHQQVVALGRWRHLWRYLIEFLRGLRIHGLAAYTHTTSKRYLLAYWAHPEEVAARLYAEANHANYPPLGSAP